MLRGPDRFTFVNDEGDVIVLPSRNVLCPECRGEGKRDNIGVITSEEWHRDWDEEEQERYLAGFYDVTCHLCCGNKVVKDVDESRVDSDTLAQFHKYKREMAECDAIERAERAAGA